MAALYAWTNDSDAPVAEGMCDVFASERSELDQYDSEWIGAFRASTVE
jgi:hypothetical protein